MKHATFYPALVALGMLGSMLITISCTGDAETPVITATLGGALCAAALLLSFGRIKE